MYNHTNFPNMYSTSLRRALNERPEEANPAVAKDLQKMLALKNWHGVRREDPVTPDDKATIIRSSMFLKVS